MPTKYGIDIRIHIGWVDADGSLDIAYRTLHHFGLKFNIDFRFMEKHLDLYETCKELINELIEEASYNIRGKRAGIRDVHELSDLEFEKWDGEMFRRKDHENRDYIGRAEEAKDLAAVLEVLKKVVVVGGSVFTY